MAQYDFHLTQNVHNSGVEFAEKVVNIPKGAILTSNADRNPIVVQVGSNGYIIEADSTQPGGFKWVAKDVTHAQNTDTGTTSQTFDILSGGNGVRLKADSVNQRLELKTLDDTAYRDFKARDVEFEKVTINQAVTSSKHAATKEYVDNVLGANNAMVFKGSVGTGGTYTIAAFNALMTYNAGWVFVVIEAGTIKGKVCEEGDTLMAMVTRGGSGGQNDDWIVKQVNIDGAVTGPVSSTDGYPVLFDGASGKKIKQAASPLGTAAFAATGDFATAAQGSLADTAIQKATLIANSILYASIIATPDALSVPASTIVGRKASGGIAALTAAEARTILNVADGATANAKATGAEIDTGTDDVKFATPKAIADSKIVKGPASVTLDSNIAIFDGVSGKLLKDSVVRIGDLKGNWVSPPGSKTATGTAGAFAYDTNFLYICVAANTWARTPIARTW